MEAFYEGLYFTLAVGVRLTYIVGFTPRLHSINLR